MNQKRVLMILPTFNHSGGIESFVMNNFRKMDVSEFKVDVISHDVHALDFVQEIESKKGQVFVLPKFTLRNFSQIKKRYLEILSQNQYDVVHCHMANAAFLYLKYAKKKDVPVRILHSHQNKAAANLTHALRNYPLLYIGKRYSNINLACSQEAGDFLFKDRKYYIVRNAIDYEKYKFNNSTRHILRQKLGIEESEIVIGHTGRLTTEKNQIYLLQLFHQLKIQNDYSYKLILVGDGKDLDKLNAFVMENRLEDAVIFLGSRDDVSNLLQVFDIFVFPSLYEGLGISLLEAQASGLPCITSTKVPIEAKISDNLTYLELSSPSKWLTEISKAAMQKGANRSDIILKEEYNIETNADLLFNYYRKYLKVVK